MLSSEQSRAPMNEMPRRYFRNEEEALDQSWLFSVSGLDDPDLP